MDRTREALLHELNVDKDGIIRTHGIFFLERCFVPFFWDKAQRGEYDEIYIDTRNQRWFQFRVRNAYRREYPELGAVSIIRVRIHQHVVCSWTMSGLHAGASET
jgi:hypothetical protein